MSAERRRATRYQIVAPVRFEEGGAGVTCNVSTSGLFFETEEARSIGQSIGFFLDFEDASVQGEGRVVRVERLDGKFGVAAELSSYGFI